MTAIPTATSTETAPRRVALIADAGSYVGVPLARLLAGKGHDLVLGNPAKGLVAELEYLGAAVEVVPEVHNLNKPESSVRLVQAALDRFGRIDAATMFSGRIVTGSFLTSTADDLAAAVRGCIEAPYHFLRAVVPVMVDQRDGQVLVLTSAAGARPTPNAPLYSAARAAATMLVKNVAAEVASRNVQVNALGTNYMDFPAFRAASGAEDPAVLERIVAAVPQRRLGTVDECAAFCMAFLDGTSRFTTGQFVAYAGGWV
jgi:3-oxoacyl-[acyl-carrier protein] reductase